MNALSNGFAAYRLALSRGTATRPVLDGRLNQYSLTWDAYVGALYDKRNGYGPYLSENGLYNKTRLVYALVEDVVDFYAYHVYPGVIDDQGVPNDEQLQQGIPLVADDRQVEAIKQLWQWSAWGAAVSNWITYGSATGDTFLGVVDDVEAGRVYLDPKPPWTVVDLQRNSRGFVDSYAEQYDVWDAKRRAWYRYRREMDVETIRTFRDGQPFDYGPGATYPNPYGFVPLVYTQHRFSPTVPGRPAFRNWKCLDEVNSVASRTGDYIFDQADSPMIFSNAGKVSAVQVDGETPATARARTLKLLQMERDGAVQRVPGNLELGDAEKRIDSLLAELRERNIEVTTYQRMRESGNPSGVAARRLLGDVEARLSGPAGNYDGGQILALRQALAIGGMRAREAQGGWALRTSQQRLFLPFDMSSYEKGDLDFGIAPRPLIPDTDLDKAQTRLQLYSSYKAGIDVKIPLETQLEDEGASPQDIQKLHEDQRKYLQDTVTDDQAAQANQVPPQKAATKG